MIFADADFFIGFLHEKDAHHKKCLQLIKKINEDIITSWDVIDEVVTKLSYYQSKKVSLRFLKRVIEEKINVFFPNPALFLAAKEIFAQQTSKKISFTDCVNMAIAKEKDIKYFLSFDTIYEKNGFKLVK